MDTSVLVGQLSSMIGKGLDWDEPVQTTDENGETVITSEPLSGVITGVNVSDGVTKVVVETEDGQKYKVDIANISRVYNIEEEVADELAADNVEPLAAEMITAEA